MALEEIKGQFIYIYMIGLRKSLKTSRADMHPIQTSLKIMNFLLFLVEKIQHLIS